MTATSQSGQRARSGASLEAATSARTDRAPLGKPCRAALIEHTPRPSTPSAPVRHGPEGEVRCAEPAGQRVSSDGIGDALALDWTLDPAVPLPSLPERMPTQGNLDPLALVAGGEALDRGIDRILEATRGRPHIFNLGHGVVPETPIAHVERLVARVREAG